MFNMKKIVFFVRKKGLLVKDGIYPPYENLFIFQKGKSLTEMLGVLALIGVLSVLAVSGLKTAQNKHKANILLHDASLAFANEITSTEQFNTDWVEVPFSPQSGRMLFTTYDLKGHVYVLAMEVEQGVCEQLLKMQKRGTLSFYNEDATPKISCEDKNNIIFAFNGLNAPAECLKADDCGDFYDGYCNKVGRCFSCTEDQFVNDNRTGCTCDDKFTTCSNDIETWCCPKDKLCGLEVGENQCITGDGQCFASFTAPEIDAEIKYYTDCSYKYVLPTIDEEIKYYTDCAVEIVTDDNVSVFDGQEMQTASFSEIKSCDDPKEYCNIYWTDSKWEIEETVPTVTAETTQTILYGKCRLRDVNSSAMLPSLPTGNLPTAEYKIEKECPQSQYCLLKYTAQKCSSGVSADSDGLIYGVCVDKGINSGICPY